MPLAGQRIRAADFGAPGVAVNNTQQANIGTTFTEGSPEVGTTFVPPTSGVVQVSVSAFIQDNGGTNRGFVEFEIYEGDDASGTAIITVTNTQYRAIVKGTNASEPETGQRTRIVEGLTPTVTHYARVMVAASGGTTVDFNQRAIDVVPIP